jgi:hypothetical protein
MLVPQRMQLSFTYDTEILAKIRVAAVFVTLSTPVSNCVSNF